MRRYLINEKGQSLIEILVALAIVVIVILALVGVTTVSIRNATFAKNRALATKYAQEWMEETRKERDENINFFDSDCVFQTDNPGLSGIFSRVRTCGLDGDTMTVKVTVSWSEGGVSHKSELVTHLTNWK
jgi:Tfp pilus assembly protein PilV